MKILIFNWKDPKNPSSGGAESVTMQHAKAWVRAGNKVTWFTSSFPNAKDKEMIDGVTFIRKGSWLTVYFWAPFFYIFSSTSYDIVVDEIHGIPFFTPIYVRKPKVVFIHEVAVEIWDYMFPFPLNIVGRFLESFFISFYRNIPFITVSDSTKKDLQDLGIANISVITNGLDIPVARTTPKKESKPTFIFLSRIVRMKGIDDIVIAFNEIEKVNKESQLWIVGTGDNVYINRIKKEILQLGLQDYVTFFERVSEKKKLDLLRRASVLLHASIKEGWGLVVAEAASQGTPAVVYNVGGLRDSVKHNKTGIVLKENTPELMASEAIELIANKTKYEEFQGNCLSWARTLRWPEATDKSLTLLKNIIENSKAI